MKPEEITDGKIQIHMRSMRKDRGADPGRGIPVVLGLSAFMGTYGVVSPCPDCPMMDTAWAALMLKNIPYEEVTERQKEADTGRYVYSRLRSTMQNRQGKSKMVRTLSTEAQDKNVTGLREDALCPFLYRNIHSRILKETGQENVDKSS